MAKTISENLNMHVLKGFCLKCRGVSREKSYFACYTDKGVKYVRKASVSSENIMFQHNVKETLYNNGFVNIDRFILSSSGLPYVEHSNELYVVTDCVPQNSREANFYKKSEFLEVVSAVAQAHSIPKKAGVNTFSKESYIYNKAEIETDVDELYNRHISDLRGYKKFVSRLPRFSDFDVMFIKNYEFFTEQLYQWYEIAKQDIYKSTMTEAVEKRFVCHNMLKEEVLYIMQEKDVYITNFSECEGSHFIKDLSFLIKRYLKAISKDSSEKDIANITDVIECYNKINSLTNQELQVLKAFILFPEKFLKICSKYYIKKRTWIPATFMERMESIIENKEKLIEYIAPL